MGAERDTPGQHDTQRCQTCKTTDYKYKYLIRFHFISILSLLIIPLYIVHHSFVHSFHFFHKALLKSSNTVNISRRPMSITNVATHLAVTGNAA